MASGEPEGRQAMPIDGWSKSSLKSLLEGCSWQWALQKLGGLDSPSGPHACAGTGLHAALEAHEQARIEGAELSYENGLYLAATVAYREGQTVPDMWQRIHGDPWTAAQWAAGMWETWWSSDVRQRLLTYTPLATEWAFRVPTPGSPLPMRGFIDWVGRDADGVLTVIDWKSASNLRRWKNGNGQPIEAASYLLGAAEWEPDGPRRIEWHVVSRKGESVVLEGPSVVGDDIDPSFEVAVLAAQALLDDRAFTPNPSWNLCSDRWCPFYHGCQVSGSLSPEQISFDASQQQPEVFDSVAEGMPSYELADNED
jgi:hypothetical protein